MATMVAASSARLELFLEFDGAPPRRSVDFHLVTRRHHGAARCLFDVGRHRRAAAMGG